MVVASALALLVVIFTILLAWPRSHAPLPSSPTHYVLGDVRILDVEQESTGPPTSIEIRDGRIVAIGTVSPGAPRIDAGGGVLMPAFWDMHMHSFQLSPQLHFPLWVANGVLNVRDMMGCPGERDSLIACAEDKKRWNDAVAAGTLAAPRIVSLTSFYFEDRAMTPAEARRRVAAYDARGIDAIKVYNWLNRPAYDAVADEAAKRGIALVGHLPKRVALEDAIAAGQASFEHAHLFPRHCFKGAADWRAGRLDDLPPARFLERVVEHHDRTRCAAAYRAMAAADAAYVPTLVTREEDWRAYDASVSEDPRLDWLDPLSRWAWEDDRTSTRAHYGADGEKALRAYFDLAAQTSAEAARAGVTLLVGTDTALGGFRYHDELALLVKAGLPPAAVLRAATLDAARFAGDPSRGRIAVGQRADLVLLTADPLDDISRTRDIRAVVHGGRYLDRAALDALLKHIRAQAAAPHLWAKLLWGFARSSVNGEL